MQHLVLDVAIIVPRNIMSLCSSIRSPQDEDSDQILYDMREEDPEGFQKILDIIHRASDGQFIIRKDAGREGNVACLQDLEGYNAEAIMWNREHPDRPSMPVYTPGDIIRMITAANYKQSKKGTHGRDKGKDMHEFDRIEVPFFTRGLDKVHQKPSEPLPELYDRESGKTITMYVKFITPEEGKNIDVVSFHRGVDV